jgi:hypothetical protein
MAFGKIRSLHVRPFQSSDLAFNSAGILSQQDMSHARLGTVITAFDMNTLTSKLSMTEPGNPGKLLYDATKIKQELAPYFLFALNNDLLEATLQQAVAQREMAYLQKYKHKANIIAALNEVYDPASASGKLKRLDDYKKIATERAQVVRGAYETTDGYHRSEVLKETKTATSGKGEATSTTSLTPVAMFNQGHNINVDSPGGHSTQVIDSNLVIPRQSENGQWHDLDKGEFSFKSQQTKTADTTAQISSTQNQEFRNPFLENLLREQRTQIDLQDEILNQKVFSLTVPETASLIDKELAVLDFEIRKVQLRFAQTFLVSPIAGLVTNVYKDLGEVVQPGESVIRVESNSTLLLVGIVQYRSGLQVGKQVKITTSKVYESNDSATLTGKIVSVRGHDSDDDEWDLVIEANNGANLPINYHFDRDTTTFEIS